MFRILCPYIPCFMFFVVPFSFSLYAVAVVVAAKFLDDTYYTNEFYSTVCQIRLKMFNDLEHIFVSLIGFQFNVTVEEFEMLRKENWQRQLDIHTRQGAMLLQQQPRVTAATTAQQQTISRKRPINSCV